ncbi:SpdD protein [Streptomyces fimicarius]|uniref:SpdD protein n=1 Tax=Streptomyces griseus TaxID=1911 RepID=UPI0036D0D5CB
MLTPKYPQSDTHTFTPASHNTAPAPVPTERIRESAPAVTPTRSGVVDAVRANPVVAITGTLVVGAVVTSMLLAVAITALALSVSGVVLLVLVRILRQELNR